MHPLFAGVVSVLFLSGTGLLCSTTIMKASGEELLAAPTKSPWVKVPGEKILGWTKEPTGKKTIGWTKVPIKGKTVIEKRYPTAQGWTVRKRYPAKPSTGKAPGTSLMKSPRHHTDRTGLDRSE